MMGNELIPGVIPLAARYLFSEISKRTLADSLLRFSVEVSYMEIYNEKVRDLLNPLSKASLRVREHPSLGPYVEDLSKMIVSDASDVLRFIAQGSQLRTVAATNMNEGSSRSHAVVQIVLSQARQEELGIEGERVSRISFVDLV
jgi:kinesin family protein 1